MSERTCSIDGCDSPVCGHGWCSMHYQRWRRHGDPLVKTLLPPKSGPCREPECAAPVRSRNINLCNAHYRATLKRQKQRARLAQAFACEVCGTEFKQTSLNNLRKYCGRPCYLQASRKKNNNARRVMRSFGRVQNCMWCGVDITHKRNCAQYCSVRCSHQADQRDNAERIRANAKRYNHENREQIKAAHRRYYLLNRERLDASNRAWAEANPDRHREIGRRWYRKTALESPEKLRQLAEVRLDRLRTNGGGALRITQRDWHRVLVIHGHRCAYCGGSAGTPLEVEHVIPVSRGGRHSLGNVVPACRSCNSSKNDRLLVEWRYDRRRPRRDQLVAAHA